MKIITSKFKHNLSLSEYSLSDNSCFLDIETMGLNRNRDMIYLVGILYFDNKDKLWTLDQYFAERENDEKIMLLELSKTLSNFHTIITYNGNSFDIPYINNRLKLFDINYEISLNKSLDLYRIVRQNRQYLNLENLRLKTLERSIGIFREDIYSGKDCIDFYRNYLLTKSEELKENVLKHNYEDLFYMLDLFKILDIIKEKKTVSLSINDINVDLIIEDLQVKGDYLNINGNLEGELSKEIHFYRDNYKILIDEKNSFIISIEFQKGLITPEEKCLYIRKDDFPLLLDIQDRTKYSTPKKILLLQVEKQFKLDNIKNIISSLINKTFNI